MAKIAGKDLVFKIGNPLVEVCIFDPKLDQTADEIDVTDSCSSGDTREFIDGFITRGLTFSRWFDDGVTPLAIGDEEDFEWTVGGSVLTGVLRIMGASFGVTVDTAHRYDYTAKVIGAPVWT
ncbi:MAG: hypothetical protein GY853_09575 [PVC group bacterium]|nr:hypothetical protein [PVC group bacterium]